MTPLNLHKCSLHAATVYVPKIISFSCSEMFRSVLTGQESFPNNEASPLLYPRTGSVSAESWFVKSPLAGPHRHRATHTMTQWRLCGLDQGPPAVGEEGEKPHKTWLMSLSLSLPFFCSLSACLSIASSSPCLSSRLPICHYPHSHQTSLSVSLRRFCPTEMHRTFFFMDEQT